MARPWPPERTSSQQVPKFVHAKTSLPNNRPQCASIQLPVIGHDDLSKGMIAPKDPVAAMLPHLRKAGTP